MTTSEKLNAKQRAFVLEYLKDGNGTQAAIRAGYSAKTAYSIGGRLLNHVEVQAAIHEARAAREKRTLVTADWVVLALKEVAERCMQRVPVMVKVNGTFEPATETVPCDCEDPACKGTRSVGVYEFDSTGANRALELLGRHTGAFKGDGEGAPGTQDFVAVVRDLLAEARAARLLPPPEPKAPGEYAH